MIRFLHVLLAALLLSGAAQAQTQPQGFGALARLDAEGSSMIETRAGVEITLALSQGVPYRAFTLAEPARLVLDFREVDWGGVHARGLSQTGRVADVRVGGFRPGWSRMVVDLAAPLALAEADLRIDEFTGTARLILRLEETAPEDFAARSGLPNTPGWDAPEPEKRIPRDPDAPIVIVLDPGHGGIDPGAETEEILEKDLMLSFARQLKEMLLRTGAFEVVLTRDDDSFVSLERRVQIAHRAGADVFLSLHADSLGEGNARGATVYTLSEDASDEASAALAERHERADLLAGADLSGSDDVVADILMDLARMETQPRADLLARALILGIRESGLPLNNRPQRSASFSVLKSPDIPSILLELGFLSSGRDLGNMIDPEWRLDMAIAITDGLKAWRLADAAGASLVRQ
ncbi:N-acetylmuramoyl-L-alanine amidase [Roseovarius sp. LXJ103]|uniref:N-acetylmuramoyl-L-alanine amidase n=1 Tax=Roseovarius carneus TaxID=2853164 RepID=UPI000D606347|nr:N-acetylmuramoyl-L-alanine amidase [Roseovarius carneus]MBZ8119218.1 N-acetylmuramoyl-L-alanine amidase [Roseovarius carneus]PWE35156.1 N-acetylmuramoyl-L-alanine amidase [Pelagicola sp. LXJ1103]